MVCILILRPGWSCVSDGAWRIAERHERFMVQFLVARPWRYVVGGQPVRLRERLSLFLSLFIRWAICFNDVKSYRCSADIGLWMWIHFDMHRWELSKCGIIFDIHHLRWVHWDKFNLVMKSSSVYLLTAQDCALLDRYKLIVDAIGQVLGTAANVFSIRWQI